MSEEELERLPEDLANLFARESESYDADDPLAESVLSRVTRSTTLRRNPDPDPDPDPDPEPPNPTTAAAAKKLLAGSVIASLAFGGALGGYAGYTSGYVAGSHATSVDAIASVSAAASQPLSTAPSIVPSGVASHDAVPRDPQPSALARATPSAESNAPADLRRERELIDAARAALVRGNAKEALSLLGSHVQKYPRGQLIMEREALRKHALKELARQSADGGL